MASVRSYIPVEEGLFAGLPRQLLAVDDALVDHPAVIHAFYGDSELLPLGRAGDSVHAAMDERIEVRVSGQQRLEGESVVPEERLLASMGW